MFHGSLVAIITPMLASGELDLARLQKLVEWHVVNGTDGIVVTGTTGEAPTLDFAEQKTVIRCVVDQAAQRIPVIAGTGSNCTRKTIEHTIMAMDLGVDACLLVTPYYNKPTQEGLFQHYQAIAKAVPIPQILYNVPSRTGCEILPETVARLAVFANIIGIKEGRVERAKEILKLCARKIDVYSGDDITALEVIEQGGKGVISVVANVAPRAMHEMCQAALQGESKKAHEINEQLMSLHKDLFVETNPIPVKWGLHEMGMIEGGIRLPLTPLSEIYHAQIRAALAKAAIAVKQAV